MNRQYFLIGALVAGGLLVPLGLATMAPRPAGQGSPSPAVAGTPPAVHLDYAVAGLTDPIQDGYAFQGQLLARIPQVLDQVDCHCGCNRSLKSCYTAQKCPPT